jgi:hypothetical protein
MRKLYWVATVLSLGFYERSIEFFQQTLRELLHVSMRNCCSSYHKIKQASKVIYNPNDLMHINNKLNIEFTPRGETDEEQAASALGFSNIITKELRLR